MSILKRASGGCLASVALVIMSTIGVIPVAHADIIGTPTHQLTSLWTEWQDTACVAISEQTIKTGYPSQSWNTKVSSAKNGGEYSFEATIKGFLSLSYTPQSYCKDAYVLNSNNFILRGELYFWNGSAWTICQTNLGSIYGSYWATTSAVTWGFGVFGGGGSSGGCGAGWYYSAGTGRAWQNGDWRGVQNFLTNAGNSGPIWMD
jgi:hypothetical protein